MYGTLAKMSIYTFLLFVGLFSISVMARSNENQASLELWFSKWTPNKNAHACGNRLEFALWKKCGEKYQLKLNGGLSSWGDYKRCTDCGANINYVRSRSCTQPKPQGSGATCQGAFHETLKCGMQGFCKEIPADHRLTKETHHKNKTSLASCMAWCRSKVDCGFVAYGVKGENKEKWCLHFSKAQLAKGCTPTYAAAEQKKADLDIEYNIHLNNEDCDLMNFEHNTCGHIKDGVGHCNEWDNMHVAGPFYDTYSEVSCRKMCEATTNCGVFTLGKPEGNRPGTCELWMKGAARKCSLIEQKQHWQMYSKNKCDDEAIRKWGPVRGDGKCGASPKADCHSGRCCSQYGWCGTSLAYCVAGTEFDDGAPTNVELFDEPNQFELNEKANSAHDAETYVKSAAKEEDDKFSKDEEEDTPVKGMKPLSDVLTARTKASQFLHSRSKRGLYNECCNEMCDHHEIVEVCEDKRENHEENREGR